MIQSIGLAVVKHVLTTGRLVLRPVRADDHAALLAHWAAPGVRRFLFDGLLLSAAEITQAIEDSVRDGRCRVADGTLMFPSG
jgi:[ribosomal protein S5]-alanine N-acetyltransferase